MRRRLIVALTALALLPGRAPADAILPQGRILRGRFVQQRHLRGFDAPLRSEGSFVLALGHGLIWRAETPFAVTTVITAEGLVQDLGGGETLKLPASRLPFIARLYSMLAGALSGDWRAVEQDFATTRTGIDASWLVRLTPRQQDALGMPFQAISIRGSRFVDEVRIDRTDGDYEVLAFLDQALSAGPLAADEAAALALIRP